MEDSLTTAMRVTPVTKEIAEAYRQKLEDRASGHGVRVHITRPDALEDAARRGYLAEWGQSYGKEDEDD